MNAEQFIISLFKEQTARQDVARNEVLTKIGSTENRLYYVHEGLVCAFYINDGEEQVIRFGYQGSIMNALPSFFGGRPSELEIRAVRSSLVSSISRTEFLELSRTAELSEAYIDLLELFTIQQMEREFDLLTASPAERLERVRARSPQLFQEVPLKYIASYLRMTPETLSRIMSKS